MAAEFPDVLPQETSESENLLSDSCHQGGHIYYEMEMSETVRVETKDAERCFAMSGSTRYVLAAIVASLGGVLFGYDLGIVSGAILQLKKDFNLDCQQQEMVVSSMLFGALLGSLAGGYIIDRLGRRRTIIINAFIFFAGALTLALSPSYALLIVGRLIVGFGTSLSAIAECIYIAEIAPPRIRGLLVSLNEIGIVVGLLLAYLVNYLFINTDSGWRYMFGLSGIPALIQGYGIIFLPASPRWLVCQGQDAKALKILRLLNHSSSPEDEITKMKDALNVEHSFNICYLFGHRQNMRDRMFVGLGMVFFQQFTGQPSVLYYAPSIFENIGFPSHKASTLATVGIGITKFLATVITLCFVDKAGRRRFLLGGSIFMTISISVLFLVTLCFPGGYHKELCDNAPVQRLHPTQPTMENFTLSPSLTRPIDQTTIICTSSLTYLSKSHSSQVKSFPFSSRTDLYASATIMHASASFTKLPIKTSGHQKIEATRICLPAVISTTVTSNTSAGHLKPGNSSKEEIPAVVKYVTIFSLMVFAGAYSSGYGPVSWLVLSEIFPTEIKGRAFAATTVLNWSSNLVVSLTMLDLIDSVGVSWTFFIYGGIGVLAIFFIYKFVPETKNRSLEEVNALFSTRRPFLDECFCIRAVCSRSWCQERYTSVSSTTPKGTGLLEEDDWQM